VGLDTVELFIAVEEEFGVRINDADASRMGTVGDLFENVLALLAKEGRLLDREIAWTRYVSVVVEQVGVESTEVVPEARFGDDLRMD